MWPDLERHLKLTPVLRIRDVYLNFSIPDTGSKRFRIPDPDPHRRIEEFLAQKLFLSSRKYNPGCSSWIQDFPSILEAGSRSQKGTGPRIRNTATHKARKTPNYSELILIPAPRVEQASRLVLVPSCCFFFSASRRSSSSFTLACIKVYFRGGQSANQFRKSQIRKFAD